MGLILRTAVLTDLGLRRTNNEDAAFAGTRLLAVADGMGGLPAGELASDLAIQALAGLDAQEHDDPVAALKAAFDDASERVRAAGAAESAREGMGTTVTALLFHGARAGLMHVGDSRAYLFRDAGLSQLTRDDTFVQGLVDQGVLTPEGARNHPQRALVTQAMQGQPITPYSALLDVRAGDVFLLCSDGLSDVVDHDTIAGLLAGAGDDLPGRAAALVAAAVDAGGPDNVTVVLAAVADDAPA